MTPRDFAQSLALLSATVGKKMPDDQVAAWYAILGTLTAEELRQGIVTTLQTHRFAGFPPVGEVLANSGAAEREQDQAVLAWATVRSAIRKVGTHKTVRFEDPVINACVRHVGGWKYLGDVESDKLQWIEKEFIKTYRPFVGKSLPATSTRKLVGLYNNAERVTVIPMLTEQKNRPIGMAREPGKACQLCDDAPLHERSIDDSTHLRSATRGESDG